MSSFAIISDLHSNTEALEAVFADIRRMGIEDVVCLGDVIGYGPNPRECIDLLLQGPKLLHCIRGNHEEALLDESSATEFNDKARSALDWTRDQLSSDAFPWETNERYWNFIGGLPERADLEDNLFVHGSPRDPIREYLLPRDSQKPEKMRILFERMDQPKCFVGHSHVPGIYTTGGEYYHPSDLQGGTYRCNGEKTLVNVGSVGQPRDGDVRASYVTVSGDEIRFHRVEYDFRAVMKKIYDTSGLPDYLADRLEKGR
ncbi:MAG: metallophosphoesterase family protein [Planctomycetota bacterium]